MKKLSKEQILKIPKMVETMTFRQIAEELGVSDRTIAYWVDALKKAGVRVPTRLGPKPLKLK